MVVDNVKITISQEKIYIKKGNFRIQQIYKYTLFYLVMEVIIIILFLKVEKGTLGNKYLLQLLNDSFLLFLMKVSFFSLPLFLLLFLSCRNLYLEEISCSDRIKINGINYKIDIEYNFLKEVKVALSYRFNYSLFDRGSYYSHFRDKCTIIFITQNDEEYEWGFKLSYQKGMEIKKMIEERMALNLSKKNENV